MLILNIILFFIILFLISVIFHKKRQEYKIICILQDFLNSKINVDFDEKLTSQIITLLKRLQENHEFILESSNKNKCNLQSMISDLSHQLKTPLSNIKMYQSFLSNDDLTSEESYKFNQNLRIQIAKIEWIIHSLINCIRLEENTINFTSKNLPIIKTITEAIDSVQINAELKNIKIQVDENLTNNVILHHNFNWTREVLINILENAIKYSKDNSFIFIKITQMELYSIISITDQGMGILPNELTQIFQRFYRGKNAKNIEGSGIGLYLCRLILEKENGYIDVISEYGKGSTFNIWLQNEEKICSQQD